MQFRVPQFIETEDKIVGPFSLRQFMYVGSAGGLSFILYFTVETFVWFILSLILVSLGLALAFVKINGQELLKVVLAGFKFYWKPQTYVWQPDHRPQEGARTEREGFSLQNIVAGRALKTAWRYVQTGSVAEEESGKILKQKPGKERYQVFRRTTGKKRPAKHVIYR